MNSLKKQLTKYFAMKEEGQPENDVKKEVKKIEIKINIVPKLGSEYRLDKVGKSVVIDDALENYIKKVFTEYYKVQEILKKIYQENN